MSNNNPFFHDESDIAQRVVWKNMNAKSSCSIASVVGINAAPVSVSIQPLVKYFDQIGGWTSYPVLKYVPVAQMQTVAYSINTPLKVGDTGLVLWFDREVYTCLQAGATTTTTPDSGNLFDTNACVFLPLMPAFNLANQLMPSGVDIISAEVSLITQLLTLLTDLNTYLAAIVTAGVPYAGAPTMPVVGAYPIALTAASTSLISEITTIITALTTFKGAQP